MQTSITQKALFGAYLNTAQHNAYLIINEVNEKVLGAADTKEGSLPVAVNNLLKMSKLTQQRRAANLLIEHFPFLRAFVSEDADVEENQIDILWRMLDSALQRLNKERNNHSHWKLQTIDFSNPENTKYRVPFVEQPKRRFIGFLGEDNTKQREIANRKYPEIGKNQYKYIQKYAIKNKNSFWADSTKEGEDFSKIGLIYFICLFLEKKQANLFLSSLKGFKNTTTENFRAVRAMFTHHCCFLPQPRLESSDILLDVLGELRRCPATLYDLLSDESKSKFQHKIVYKAGFDAEPVEEFSVSKRYDDRFPYFVLRYLDDTNALPDIRFQLYVGKIVNKKYKAKIIGELTDRYLFKEIHVFDKLSEFWEKKPVWTINNAPTASSGSNPLIEGQMTQYSPHYHISGNRVYLKMGFKKGDEEKTNLAPDAVISIHELQNLLLYTHLYPQELNNQHKKSAQIFISKYIGLYRKFIKAVQEGTFLPIVLPPDFYKKRLKGKESKEMRINQVKSDFPYSEAEKAEITARRERLQEKLDTDFKGMKVSYLPDEIREYLLGFQQNDYRYKALFFIDTLKKETNERLHKIKTINKRKKEDEKERKENGKEGKTRTLKAGDIAQWLAKDLIFLKKPDKSKKNDGKPNNQQYDRLQEMLAYFPLNRNLLNRFFNEMGFLSGAGKHAFLEKVNPDDFHSLFSFYEKYLGEKKAYLIALYTKIDLISFFTNQVGSHYLRNYDEKVKDKIQQKLQKYLAHFDKVALKKLFERNQITDLQNIDKWNDLEEFFEKYPKRSSEYKIWKVGEIESSLGYLFSFVNKKVERPQKNYEKPNANNDYKIPIALPKGLFNDAIVEALIQKGINLKPEDNILFALAEWQAKDKQVFYDFPKNYTMHRPTDMNRSAFDETEIKAFEKQVTENREVAVSNFKEKINQWNESKDEAEIKKGKALKSYRDDILETEKALRFEEHKDRVLWLMARGLANNKEFLQKGGVEITDIDKFSLASLESFLDTYVEMSIKIITIDEVDKKTKIHHGTVAQIFERDENKKIKTVSVPVHIRNKITGKLEEIFRQIPIVKGAYEDRTEGKEEVRKEEYTALTIKDYGDLRRFAKDRRLPNLFRYFYKEQQEDEKKLPTLSKTELEKGLSYLELHRQNILQKAMDLEEAVHNNLETEFNAFHGDVSEDYIEHNSYIKFLEAKFILSTIPNIPDAETIINLRNKIAAHNQVPYNDFLKSRLVYYFKEEYLKSGQDSKKPKTLAEASPEAVITQILQTSLDIYQQLIAKVEEK
jgi:hypothetical protein